VLPEVADGNEHVYYLYVVRHSHREDVLAKLAERDVVLNVSYRWPVHTMSGFQHLGYGPGALPVTERLAQQIFSLPMYPTLTDRDQTVVIEALLDAV